jgi:hypothetical protein
MSREANAGFRCARLVPLVGCLYACSFLDFDPHENFKRSLEVQIGKSADDRATDTGRLYSNRIGERILPNGNTEIGFKHLRACRYYFEIDKGTRKIVGSRWEGTQKDCSVPL